MGHFHLKVCYYFEEGFSKLRVLWDLPPLSLVDMLYVTGGSFSTYGSITSLWYTSLGLFCLPQLWSLLFDIFSFPFLGAFYL